MTESADGLELARCGSCQARFLPGDGPCPRCGARQVELYRAPAVGRVIAATEVVAPAEGWSSPHLLALVEVADAVRLLAVVEGSLPARGAVVGVRAEGPIYRARAEPGTEEGPGRGEGESPRSGASGPSFEPPR